MPRLGDLEQIRGKLERIQTKITLHESIGLDNKLALTIIDSLRMGTAPAQGAIVLAVGRDTIIENIHKKLDEVSKGNSALMVLSGDYGMGKTLTLRILQDYAFQGGFATSFITLTPRECPLYDLRAIYQHIVKNIRVQECRDRPALEWILENWAEKVKNDMQGRGKAPWSFWRLNLPFKEVLTIYFNAMFGNNFVLAERALSWIHADIKTLKDARQIGLSLIITPSNALEMLGNVTRMIRELGLRGLVILLDEAETIPSVCGISRRIEAYDNLHKLSTTTSNTPYSYFVYATTPLFFDHLAEYGVSDLSIADQAITTLENLSSSEYLDLALIIRDLYLQAYGWRFDPRIKDTKMRSLISTYVSRIGGNATPRLIVRAVVKTLDLCHENQRLTLQDIVPNLVENFE